MKALQYTHDETEEAPRLRDIEARTLSALFDQNTGPTVYVMRTSQLEKLMGTKEAKARIAPLKQRNKSKGLPVYFKGSEPVALNGNYVIASRLVSGVRTFFAKARDEDSNTYFLGTSDEIYRELARGAREETDAASPQPTRKPTARPEPSVPPDTDEDWLATFQGDSPQAQEVRELIELAALAQEFADFPVLILGPSGAGKEVVARAIHEMGRGALGGRRVDVNCAAIPTEMFEAELFGTVGEFASNVGSRIGLWEQASLSNGTLHLNEVGDLTLAHQAKILRALQEGVIRRVGGRDNVEVNARIIADTNRDLIGMMAREEFRPDLFYRLAQLVIRVPGLSERGNDFEEHAQQIWRNDVTGRPEARLSPRIISILSAHSWPGGVREVEGLLRTTYSLCYEDLDPEPEALFKAWERRGDSPVSRGSSGSSSGSAASSEPEIASSESRSKLEENVSRYKALRPKYEKFADVLGRILKKAIREHAPIAIVQTRAKSVARVAERLQRHDGASLAEVEDLPDLCGGRVIVHTPEQADEIVLFLQRYFDIGAKEGVVTRGSAADPATGFHPMRLSVRLDETRADAVSKALGIKVPDMIVGIWAEVEIRTVLEHAWANVNHDMGRDVPLPLPKRWSAELDGLSRVLKAVDSSFSRIRASFQTYRTTYPSLLSPERTRREIEVLTNVLSYDDDPAVAVRLAKLAISIEDWDTAIGVLQSHAEAGNQPAMRDYGVALCQKHRREPHLAVYQRGQSFLSQAAAAPHRDPDALASLAGTLKRSGDEDLALSYYRRAHEIDPGDPYALGGVLDMELVRSPEVDHVTAHRPHVDHAIERCQDQIDASVNLPWAQLDLGRFLLMRGETDRALIALAEGIANSHASFMVQTTLESLDRLAGHRFEPAGLREARVLLALGCVAKFPSERAKSQLRKLISQRAKVRGPVVILVDGAGESGRTVSMASEVIEGFRDFQGTVISIGSGEGTSPLAADLGTTYSGAIHTVAYATRELEEDPNAARFGELHETDESDSGTLGSLQAWADILMSGFSPADVLVLCVGLDQDANFLHTASSALGARVEVAPQTATESGEAPPPVGPDIHRMLDPE